MASRRMRIKAVAKVPSMGKARVVERSEPPSFSEPSSPLINCRSPAAAPPEAEIRTGSPRPQNVPISVHSPVSLNFACLSPGYDRGMGQEDAPTRFFSLPSPGGLISPKSPNIMRKSPSPGPMKNPESPRRPTTPHTPSSFQGENSQDMNLRSPIYSPSYSAMSPGYGPGIQRIHPPPSPSPSTSSNKDSNISDPFRGARAAPTAIKKGKMNPLPSPKHSKDGSLISQVLNNSETLRQRLQSGTAVPSTSKYAMIRKDYLAKYQNNTPNPKDLTMLHYAFFNPPKPIEEAKKGNSEKSDDGEPKPPGTPKKRRRTESRDSVASSISVKSIPPDKNQAEVEPPVKTGGQSVGPRVKVGPDGQLIIDEQSLVIETSESQRAKQQLENMETVSGSSYIVGSSGIYSRKKALNRGVDWDEKETMKFYKALITCGTDFSMMATVFKGSRSRGELKAKFKREDRRNPQQVSHALAKQCFDPTLALTDSEDEAVVLEGSGSDIGDIENIKTDKTKKHRKEEVAKKEDFKKTLTTLKKKGGLSSNVLPKENSIPFRRPSGQVDWRLYAVMKNNLNDSSAGLESLPSHPDIVHGEMEVVPSFQETSSYTETNHYPISNPDVGSDNSSSLELAGSSIITRTSEILLAEH